MGEPSIVGNDWRPGQYRHLKIAKCENGWKVDAAFSVRKRKNAMAAQLQGDQYYWSEDVREFVFNEYEEMRLWVHAYLTADVNELRENTGTTE